MSNPNVKRLLEQWNVATADLPWGVQQVFRDAFQLVAEEKVTLVYGADYSAGSPCLVNSVASMLTTGGGHGIPSSHFGKVVSLFDQINRELGVNKDNTVSPMAAEVFLRYFAPQKPKPIETAVNEAMAPTAFAEGITAEVKDEDMARDWLNALQVEAAMEQDFSNCEPKAEVPVQRANAENGR